MNKEKLLNKLYSLHQFGIKLGLESTQNLLSLIGNPHQNLKCIHIAGSNGKGSTASFTASILMEMGLKVGLYTSPHFVRFNERIKVNGQEIDDQFIIDFVKKLENYIDEHKPTFFEVTTSMAFEYFKKENVDYVVLETGLGGRLDSTNVIDPLASVITSISLEHTEQLGNNIETIAFEKAGIIKKGVPVFIGNMPLNAKNKIKAVATEKDSRLFEIENFISFEDNCAKILLSNKEIKLYKTPLKGDHQFYNAALAIKTISEIFNNCSNIDLLRGIFNVVKNTGIQCRYEIVKDKPKIIFDSAHNPEGIESFVKEFKKEAATFNKRILIFGAMKDKNIFEMLNYLQPHFTKIFVTRPNMERAASLEEMAEIAKKVGVDIEVLVNSYDYIYEFSRTIENSCLVVLGSMYLLGEIKLKILEKRLDI